VRFVFSPPTEESAGLLSLPWTDPLEQWQDPRLVEIRQRGISRHVVRFVRVSGTVYAIKELPARLRSSSDSAPNTESRPSVELSAD